MKPITEIARSFAKPEPPKVYAEESNGDFKNSLASLLSKGNPLMPGIQKKATIVNEEEAPKEKIKFDIFNEEGESPDYMKKTVLDNVISDFS